ncbi:hypothetical protein [Marinimicrobium sp. ABcell2]|uniref:hypothetical protein n=1 Tax=Marinimicrobium sp. ABcell2 TaxID=3069751 RepID=UPI0027B02369|nr:hypothetical protein [Marinimicrobium sp. ABcell2]MDQ2077130.1 hypothetical protein [Marinimicrobium sp. ABcell2]
MTLFKRQLLILVAALIMASVTFQGPYLLSDDIVIETSTYLDADDQELNRDIQALLDKGSLSDEELDTLTQKLAQVSGNDEGMSEAELEQQARAQLRTFGLWLVAPLWLLFLVLLPRTWVEYLEVLALPVLFYAVGVLIGLEIAVIVGLALLVALLKPRLKKRLGRTYR